MSSDIIRQRRQEFVAELEDASMYFQKIVVEEEFQQVFRLSDDEREMIQQIYESILRLKWRLALRRQMDY
jgi:hypothetical protein